MILTITIDMETEAFKNTPQNEVSRILQELSKEIVKYDIFEYITKGGNFFVKDKNGVDCGFMNKG